MAEAVNSTSASVIPFRSRRPAQGAGKLDRRIHDWSGARRALQAARLFGPNEAQALDFLHDLFAEGGVNPIRHVLSEIAAAIQTLRGVLDELVAADQLIVSATDRLLCEAGL